MKLPLVLVASHLAMVLALPMPANWLNDFFSQLGYTTNSLGHFVKVADQTQFQPQPAAAATTTAAQDNAVAAAADNKAAAPVTATDYNNYAVTITYTYGNTNTPNQAPTTLVQAPSSLTPPQPQPQPQPQSQQQPQPSQPQPAAVASALAPPQPQLSSLLAPSQPQLSSLSSSFQSFDANQAFSGALDAVWNTFYQNGSFDDEDPKCNQGDQAPAVWPIAITGRATVELGNIDRIYKVIANLEDHKNPQGWFSASTAKDNDVYVDDNAQIAWVYCDAYLLTHDPNHLQTCQQLVDNIKTQQIDGGGIRWDLNGHYVALISTSEAGLAALRLYEHTGDASLISFAQSTLNYMETKLTDPSDGLFIDGIDINTNTPDKGKLTYTVGVTLLVLGYLNKYTGDSQYIDKARQLAEASAAGKGAFYNQFGVWNNRLQYVHLLYQGFADLWRLVPGQFDDFKPEVKRESEFVHQYLQVGNLNTYVDDATAGDKLVFAKFQALFTNAAYEPDANNFCDSNVNGQSRSQFINGGSAAQIFYAVKDL